VERLSAPARWQAGTGRPAEQRSGGAICYAPKEIPL